MSSGHTENDDTDLFLALGFILSDSSPSTPAPNSLFMPVFGFDLSGLASFLGDEDPLSTRGTGVESDSVLIATFAVGSSAVMTLALESGEGFA